MESTFMVYIFWQVLFQFITLNKILLKHKDVTTKWTIKLSEQAKQYNTKTDLINFVRFFDNFKRVIVTDWKVDVLPPITSINGEHILSSSSRHCTDTARSTPAVLMANLNLSNQSPCFISFNYDIRMAMQFQKRDILPLADGHRFYKKYTSFQ